MKSKDIKDLYQKALTGVSQYPRDVSHHGKNIARKKDIFISGGIGDFLTVHRWCIDQDFCSTCFLVTRSWHEITEILRFINPKSDSIPVLKKFPENLYSFFSLDHFLAYADAQSIKHPNFIVNSKDLSISKIFPWVTQEKPILLKSKLLDVDCANIKTFNLPKEYIGLVLQSNRDQGHASRGRNINEEELEAIVESSSVCKVCVFCHCEKPHPKIIHLRNTTVLQSIEIMKKASGYIGVDSWLSVVAGWLFPSDRVKIKCINNHGLENACCYWPLLDPKEVLVSTIQK